MKKTAIALLAVAATGFAAQASQADNAYQSLPYSNTWSNIALIAVDDDWSGVPGVLAPASGTLTFAPSASPAPTTSIAPGKIALARYARARRAPDYRYGPSRHR